MCRFQIMGILNVTPDSFSDGGCFVEMDQAVAQAQKMIDEGADIIDVGGESSRPGAEPVNLEEELRRVIPVIQEIRKQFDIPISIDTTKSIVAAQAIEAGATIINDISAGTVDSEMFSVAAQYQVPICLMHRQGTPQTMQKNPYYEEVVAEVKEYLQRRMRAAVESGVKKEKIWIDPGIGFGKRVEDNLALLKSLDQFQDLGCPILVGTSRKSFIGKITGAAVDQRLPGSLASLAIAYLKGASIFRVHDVAETKQFLQILIAATHS